MMTTVPGCPALSRQRGSALLLTLIFMAVLARMALSAVDSALLGTSLAINYRNHDRVAHGADALLIALDASLLAGISSRGLQVTLGTLSSDWVEVGLPPWAGADAGIEVLRYQAVAGEVSAGHLQSTQTAAPVCGLLYQLEVQATGVRPGTQASLSLQRRACCTDMTACETGDFLSLHRAWRRLD